MVLEARCRRLLALAKGQSEIAGSSIMNVVSSLQQRNLHTHNSAVCFTGHVIIQPHGNVDSAIDKRSQSSSQPTARLWSLSCECRSTFGRHSHRRKPRALALKNGSTKQ